MSTKRFVDTIRVSTLSRDYPTIVQPVQAATAGGDMPLKLSTILILYMLSPVGYPLRTMEQCREAIRRWTKQQELNARALGLVDGGV